MRAAMTTVRPKKSPPSILAFPLCSPTRTATGTPVQPALTERWMAAAHAAAEPAAEKASMNPSPCPFTTVPPKSAVCWRTAASCHASSSSHLSSPRDSTMTDLLHHGRSQTDSSLATGVDRCQCTMRQCAPSVAQDQGRPRHDRGHSLDHHEGAAGDPTDCALLPGDCLPRFEVGRGHFGKCPPGSWLRWRRCPRGEWQAQPRTRIMSSAGPPLLGCGADDHRSGLARDPVNERLGVIRGEDPIHPLHQECELGAGSISARSR